MKTRYQILNEIVLSSRWAGWLPFSWMQNIAARHFAKKAGKVYRQQLRDRHWRCVALYGNAKEHSRERIAKLMLAYTQLLATS